MFQADQSSDAQQCFVTFSRKIFSLPFLETFLGAKVCFRHAANATCVIGWGNRPTTQKARDYAAARDLPYAAVEDGFLRSLGLGCEGAFPLSLVVDRTGIYYDATRPSDLENLLNSHGWETPELLESAQKAMDSIIRHGLSKYNHAPDARPGILGDASQKRVLVIDQTFGDCSIEYGLADGNSFLTMLHDAASVQNARVTVKTHPDVLAGHKKGYLAQEAKRLGVHVIAQNVSPISLLNEADDVYCVTSQMGFEALLLGKSVHCYGMPFYAGWGLTKDSLACPRRKARRSLTEIFAAAYMLYARYINPIENRLCTIHDVIARLILQREKNEASRGHHDCWGYPWWKRPYARAFLQGTESSFAFHSCLLGKKAAVAGAKRSGGNVVAWSSKIRDGQLPALCRKADIDLIRMEDGFIRSVGLGSNFHWPYSLVLDRSGIYYDPSSPSDLEHILNTIQSRPDHDRLCQNAAQLRKFIISKGITKYNVGQGGISRSTWPKDRRVILVPGQVEEDASVRSGGGHIQSNLDLLKAVRSANPDAVIIFKPHPDVEAKNRKGKIPDDVALTLADKVLRGVRMDAVLPAVDEVHTLTSLTGFEALLRGIKVTAYGGPFYAGWGLCTDKADAHSPFFQRRHAVLSLDELAAGTLLLYPTYYDWQTRSFCSAMDVCHRITQPAEPLHRNLILRFFVALRETLRSLR